MDNNFEKEIMDAISKLSDKKGVAVKVVKIDKGSDLEKILRDKYNKDSNKDATKKMKDTIDQYKNNPEFKKMMNFHSDIISVLDKYKFKESDLLNVVKSLYYSKVYALKASNVGMSYQQYFEHVNNVCEQITDSVTKDMNFYDTFGSDDIVAGILNFASYLNKVDKDMKKTKSTTSKVEELLKDL